MHLSMLPQQVRYGFFGTIDFAIVEAVDVTPGGAIAHNPLWSRYQTWC